VRRAHDFSYGYRPSEVGLIPPDSETRHQGCEEIYTHMRKFGLSYPKAAREGRIINIVDHEKLSTARSKNYRRLPFGSLSSMAPLGVDRGDHETMRRCMQKRILRTLPTPDPKRLLKAQKFVENFCENNLTPLTIGAIRPTLEWIACLQHPE